MTGDDQFVFESRQDSISIRDFLESLMRGLEKEHLVLSTGGDRIELSPQGLLDFTVKARRKGGVCTVNLEIGWRENGNDERTPRTINISS